MFLRLLLESTWMKVPNGSSKRYRCWRAEMTTDSQPVNKVSLSEMNERDFSDVAVNSPQTH